MRVGDVLCPLNIKRRLCLPVFHHPSTSATIDGHARGHIDLLHCASARDARAEVRVRVRNRHHRWHRAVIRVPCLRGFLLARAVSRGSAACTANSCCVQVRGVATRAEHGAVVGTTMLPECGWYPPRRRIRPCDSHDCHNSQPDHHTERDKCRAADCGAVGACR